MYNATDIILNIDKDNESEIIGIQKYFNLKEIKKPRNLKIPDLLNIKALHEGDVLKAITSNSYCTLLESGKVETDSGFITDLDTWLTNLNKGERISIYKYIVFCETGETLESLRFRIYYEVINNEYTYLNKA